MRALIVDDSSFIRQYMRQMLQGLDIAVEEAIHGQMALEMLAAGEAFDLTLLDVNMPVMGGLACVKALHEDGRYRAMKVMMVTTEADNAFICEALDYGADEFLMKPFTLESLRGKLVLMGLLGT